MPHCSTCVHGTTSVCLIRSKPHDIRTVGMSACGAEVPLLLLLPALANLATLCNQLALWAILVPSHAIGLRGVCTFCSIHVASVMHMTHMLMHHGGIAEMMTDNQILATYYAALIHDFEHLGVNNDYLIKTFHPLAVMYNDQSPLENHHLAAAVRVMQRPECLYFTVMTASHIPSL